MLPLPTDTCYDSGLLTKYIFELTINPSTSSVINKKKLEPVELDLFSP
jgi:hypothetical protein